MKRFFGGVLFGVFAPAFLFAGVLLISADLRHATFRLTAELPGVMTYFMVRRHVIARNFPGAAALLSRQLDLVEWVSAGRNSLLPGLVENTRYVVERAEFPEELAALEQYLARLVRYQPDLLPARIWYARSLFQSSPDVLFAALDAAWKLASADERPYRIAIAAALRLGRNDLLKQWCARYREGQFGGPHPYEYNTQFFGLGLRKMALEVTGQNSRNLIGNRGIELGAARSYEFALPRPVSVRGLRLFVGLVPGVSLAIGEMRLFNGGTMRRIAPPAMTSRRGFFDDTGAALVTGRDGDVISLHAPADDFGRVDKIEMDIAFRRMSLTSAPCGERAGK